MILTIDKHLKTHLSDNFASFSHLSFSFPCIESNWVPIDSPSSDMPFLETFHLVNIKQYRIITTFNNVYLFIYIIGIDKWLFQLIVIDVSIWWTLIVLVVLTTDFILSICYCRIYYVLFLFVIGFSMKIFEVKFMHTNMLYIYDLWDLHWFFVLYSHFYDNVF